MTLTLERLSKRYERRGRAVQALDDVSLKVDAGELALVQGASGSGKSTLLLAAGGLLSPDSGSVRVEDEEVYALGPGARAQLRARHVGFIFQQFHLVPYLTVLENVLAPTLAAAHPEARRHAMALLERFSLTERAAHLPSELSTGERQRTALARALLNRPHLLLADEPTGNLDEVNAGQVMACLVEFAADGGAVLLASHSSDAARQANSVHRLEGGRLRLVTGRS